MRAFVSLIGAGPGDSRLLTLRGAEALGCSDVVLYDHLANPDLLAHAPQARHIYVGKEGYGESLPQEQINALLVEQALAGGGQRVARLKGGDVFVFGRGGEELLACREAGIPFEVIPGVTSAIAAAAYAGIPVTHRGLSRSFAVVTGQQAPGSAPSPWPKADTLVILMGLKTLAAVASELLRSGWPAATPAAVVQWGTTPKQRTVQSSLQSIAAEAAAAGLGAPAIVVVGRAVELRPRLAWFETRPLSGKQIVLTRSREGNSRLARRFLELGAEVLELALLRYGESRQPQQLRDALEQLCSGAFDWLLLTSPQAVAATFGHLAEMGKDARALAGVRIAAVGPGTAAALGGQGLRADFLPSHPGAVPLAEELPILPGQRALHPTSQLAEAELEERLLARGARVQRAEAYRTLPVTPNAQQAQALLSCDAVICASASAASALAALVPDDRKASCPVVGMGPQTAKAARQGGFQRIHLAERPDLEALVAAALELLTPRPEV